MTNRVQIPAYTDRWMMGDRYGVIVKVSRMTSAKLTNGRFESSLEMAHVKLDKSGKTLRFILDDCQEV